MDNKELILTLFDNYDFADFKKSYIKEYATKIVTELLKEVDISDINTVGDSYFMWNLKVSDYPVKCIIDAEICKGNKELTAALLRDYNFSDFEELYKSQTTKEVTDLLKEANENRNKDDKWD